MHQNHLLQAFTTLVQKSTEPLLFQFKAISEQEKTSSPPLTEILNAEYQGKIRIFELNFAQSSSILEAFRLPQIPTAVIFWKGQTCLEWQGYRNVRNFLRKVMFSNLTGISKNRSERLECKARGAEEPQCT
jgi:thioredoxin-like negative regulator of GroEL